MLSVRGSRELQAAVLAVKLADRDLRRTIYQGMRETMGPVWRDEVNRRADAVPGSDSLLTAGVLLKAGNPPVLLAANSRRKRGRRIPAEDWPWQEYGANRETRSTYDRKGHRVTRRVKRHLRPRRSRGYVLAGAAAATIPRLLSLSIQTVVRTYMDALDPKG